MEPTRQEFMHLPTWQIWAFYLGTLAVLLGAAWQVWGRVRLWRRGKPIGWRPDYFGNVWSYVVGQKKVQNSRQSSGAPMHMLIFYGFLALAIATTLLAIAWNGPIDFHKGTYFLIYEATFDAFGLVFLIGVAWAIVRRYRLVSSLGPAESDSKTDPHSANPITHNWTDYAILGLLLLLGVTGFALEAARIANNPQPWDSYSFVAYALAQPLAGLGDGVYVGIWWFHVIWVWLLFLVLPQVRLKHIVYAIFSSAGAPNRPMGELEPITMEEVEATGKLGVETPADYSRWHLMSLDACMSCGRCTEVCPAYGVGKALNPKQVVQDIRAVMPGNGSVAESVSEEALWACTTCNACVEACPVLIRHVDVIVDSRRHLVAEGRLSGSGAAMLRTLQSTGNPWGKAADEREEWMKGLDVPLCRDGEPFEYLLWVGCAGATDPDAIKTTRAVATLLRKAGVSFTCLGREESCTGDPARRAGDEFLYQEMALANIEVFRRYGVSKVIAPCPHCFNTVRREYHQMGLQLEVFHHTQVLGELVEGGRLNAANSEGITYHDPCYLARVNGVADPPRAMLGERTQLDGDAAPLIRAATNEVAHESKLKEPRDHGRKTLCCGAGGARMFMDEEPGKRPADRRAAQLRETGASTVAVACPFCRIMLKPALDDVRLVDLAEILAEANDA